MLCAGFGYYSIYKSGHVDLFFASSVFVGPAVVTSVLSILTKSGLMARRVAQRRQAVSQRVPDSRASLSRPSGPGKSSMRLEMLVPHYMLRHEKHAYDELKAANDRRRYEGYGKMLAIVTELCLSSCCAR